MFQAFATKYATWKDTLMASMPMFLLTFVRTLTWTLVFAYLKEWGFVIVTLTILINLALMAVYHRKFGQPSILGSIIASFGPCLVVHDFSTYFLLNGIINSTISMISLMILTLLVKYDYTIFSHPEAFLTTAFDNESVLQNQTVTDLFLNQHPFFLMATTILILWLISFGAIMFLHQCLDPIKRYRQSKLMFKCMLIMMLPLMASLLAAISLPVMFLDSLVALAIMCLGSLGIIIDGKYIGYLTTKLAEFLIEWVSITVIRYLLLIMYSGNII